MKWIKPTETEISAELLETVGGKHLTAELLARRGITQPDKVRAFLDADFYSPAPPDDLPGLMDGVKVLAAALRDGLRIGVWGDFDVDGQTSTTLLVSALEQLGGDVVYHIPVRATESHGMNLPHLERMLSQGIEVLLTCDTGIGAHAEIAFCRDRGIKVVVTDHHDLPEDLPEADALINSKLVTEDHPLSSLPGVGVAYKLVEALFAEFGKAGEEAQFLDLVALGIVADVALLKGDVRYLLQRGLETLRNTVRLGLQVLYELAEIEPAFLSEEDIGFSIAPRLNSVGRLGDANVIVEFLTTEREGLARVIANQLEGLNAQRRLLTSQVFQAAINQLEGEQEALKQPALVLVGERWPAGVVGIVANQLVERFGIPALLLTTGEDGALRGSARSVEGCDISQAIAECGDLLDGFGGHPMAAGLSMPASILPRFKQQFFNAIREQVGDEPLEPELHIDLELGLDQYTFEQIEEITQLGPFGAGNPPVVLLTPDLKMVSHSKLSKTGEHIRLIVEDGGGTQQSVLWWGGGGQTLPQGIFDLACSARISTYRGERQLQLELRDFQTVHALEPGPARPGIEVLDLRGVLDPEERLGGVRSKEKNILVWAESGHKKLVDGEGRGSLKAADTLVIWTAPPSWTVIGEVITKVAPERVVVFALDPLADDLNNFLERLAGLCRYSLSHHDGELELIRLAGALAQTEGAVRIGIEWLQAKGHISIDSDQGSSLKISKAGQITEPISSPEAAIENLVYLLRESASFRRTISGMDAVQLSRLIAA
jgi:single-stranded-DNA-specific exonuclease